MTNCGECKMNFCKPSSLRAHVKRKHPDKLEKLALPITKLSSSTSNYLCRECDKGFASFGNLRFHVKKKHSDKLEELAPVEKKIHKCHHCSCEFDVLKQLNKHRSSHMIMKPIKCSLCPYTSTSTDKLVEHYKYDHSLEILNEILEFDSVEAFQVWKSRTEADTFASFVQTSGAKKTLKHTKTRYLCHRSGNTRANRGYNIRKPKIGGSNKIGGYCPARMTVFTNNEKCTVHFCKTHVGHEQEKDMRHMGQLLPNCQENEKQNVPSENNLVIDIDQKHVDISGLVNNLSTTRPVGDGQQQVEERRKKLLQFVQEELLQFKF